MRSRLVSVLAATALIVTPTAAIAAAKPDASALSLRNAPVVQKQRAGAKLENPNQLEGNWVLYGAIAVAVIVGLILILDDDDEPDSP